MKLRIKAAIVLDAKETDLLAMILTGNIGEQIAPSSRDAQKAEAFKKEFLAKRDRINQALDATTRA